MKNSILQYCIIIFCTIGLFGCEDFLTLVPESQYSESGAYKTEADFKYAIAGVYAAQQGLYQSNSCWFRLMITRSDDTKTGASYTYGVDNFTDSDNIPELAGPWATLYSMIARCNIILGKIDLIEFKNEQDKSNIKGEAYALRAWSYYTLGWMFGGVPLIDKQLSVDETKQIPRSTQIETFNFVEKDFKKAISLLPESWSGSDIGRITKYAAEGVLARVYMFQSKFAEAKPYLKDIIDSGKYAMEEDYVNCFTDSHDNGKERVWEIQFTGNLTGEGQRFSTGCIPEGYVDGVIIPFAGYSTAMNVSQDMIAAYEEGDLRKDVSVITNLKVNGVIESKYYYISKYIHYDTYTPQDQSDWSNNLPILRYTDVKMMYAECLNEEGYEADGTALTILNEVRSRAGLPALTSAKINSQDTFRKAIMQERRVEFAFEGLRWNDLVRWGIAKEVMNSFFLLEDEGDGRYSMADHQTIFAIPNDEMSRYNDEQVMWQNPGY